MKIRLPLMIQDPSTKVLEKKYNIKKWFEGFHPDKEPFYLGGPVSKRLAVVDFAPEDRRIQIAAHFRPPSKKHKLGWFENDEGEKLHKPKKEHMFTPAFMEVTSFAMVLRVMYMFERPETLGRDLSWIFRAPQLLIVPRAGEKANAFYHRQSHSLQFFYVTDSTGKPLMYTCLSRDIVAHETGHAIIDSIAPDLLDACTPQSLAIHEAIADLTACLMAFESHTLRENVLPAEKGSIKNSTVFSSIAEEFGKLLGQKYGLRNLKNSKTLNPEDKKNLVSRIEPHALSQVLSGALYDVLINIHETLKKQYRKEKRPPLRKDITSQWEETEKETKDSTVSLSGYALAKATERFQRMIFRALDYLPPGEVSFADYGRALIAVDEIAYKGDTLMRSWIREQFLDRMIVQEEKALNVEMEVDSEPLRNVDLERLYRSDWTAYWFANKYRDFLLIPQGQEFEVRPRLLLKKKYEDGQTGYELLFKVAWEMEEPHQIGSRFPQNLVFLVGSTLAINWETNEVLTRLTNAPPIQQKTELKKLPFETVQQMEYDRQRADRGAFLKHLARTSTLKRNKAALDPQGNPLLSAIHAQITNNQFRVRGAGKLLHIIPKEVYLNETP